MCGISGIYNLNGTRIRREHLLNFNDSMLQRGPDGHYAVLLENETLGLAHRRLSILDLSDTGKQPMQYADGRLHITYNGEVFNFQEIRAELLKKGYRFRSDSDTEVILASYLEWGKACLDRFNGMWAFAIWDNENKELFLARDRFGIKPLYYHSSDNGVFAFASETRAFRHLEGFRREMDEQMLALNMDDPYALEGAGYTIFKGIFQLLPGHCMSLGKQSSPRQQRWWHIDEHKQEIPETDEERTEKFYELFRDACRIRLISDVPVATALSGGLDSSSVYSTVYDIMQTEKAGRMNADSQRAFTAVFPGLQNDEQAYAQKAAEYTGGPITYIESGNTHLAEKIEKDTRYADFLGNSPLTAIAGVYEGMRKNGIVVSLDGHGVDEMLYGYRDMVYGLYQDALWHGTLQETESYRKVLESLYHPNDRDDFVKRTAKHLGDKQERDSSMLFRIKRRFSKGNTTDALPVPLPVLSDRPYDFSGIPYRERIAYYEFFQHTLPALLRNFDRAGMMHSVEIRMPFMDWRLVSYVFSLPVKNKVGSSYTKLILRNAMKGRMEESLRTRTFKVGISSPIESWFSGALKPWVLDSIPNGDLKKRYEDTLKKNGAVDKALSREIWQSINLDLIK